jgi:glutathionyl-hydroquinone reductase
MGSHGWPFAKVDSFPGAGDDPVMGAEHMKDIYLAVQPDYDGRCVLIFIVYVGTDPSIRRFTVPLLFDKKTKTAVNNESSEILRIFNTAFNELIPKEKAEIDLYPQELRDEIESSHEWIYPNINSMSP